MNPCREQCFSVVGIHKLELCEGTIFVGLLVNPDASVSAISGDPNPKVVKSELRHPIT